jgi:hypothetical protein
MSNFLRRKWTAARSPSYSPDLTPSDFFLFGYFKDRLKGMVFPSYEELLDAIGEAVNGIASGVAQRVMGEAAPHARGVSKAKQL